MTVPDHVNESIAAIADLHQQGERHVTAHQRGIERITNALARPRFLYAVITVAALWMVINVGLPAVGVPAFDPPPFDLLQGVMTLSALVIASMVLITQNRQMKLLEKRGHLDLQINLLTERKIAKVIELLEELRRDLPNVRNRADPEAKAMAVRANPQDVAAALEQAVEDEAREDGGEALNPGSESTPGARAEVPQEVTPPAVPTKTGG